MARVACLDEEVRGGTRLAVCGGVDQRTVASGGEGAQICPVLEDGGRRFAEHAVRALNRLVVLAVVEVEAGCEGVGRILVEVVFGDLVARIAHEGETGLNILLDGCVELCQRTAVVDHVEPFVGDGEVGEAGILRSVYGVVGHAEHRCQDEVVVCAGDVGLAVELLEGGIAAGAQFLKALQGHVAGCDAAPVVCPHVFGALVVALGNLVEVIDLLDETERVLVRGGAEVVYIVAHELGHEDGYMVRICRAEDFPDFAGGVDLGAFVGVDIEETVACGQREECCKCRSNEIFGSFHKFILHYKPILRERVNCFGIGTATPPVLKNSGSCPFSLESL